MVKRLVSLVLAVGVSVGLWRLQPALAEPVALLAMEPGGGVGGVDGGVAEPDGVDSSVRVFDSRELLEIWPADDEPAAGFIFYPGGLVDPRAYAAMLRPIAERGYLVAVPKMPLDLAITDISAAKPVIDANGTIDTWFVGGHSLGGASSSEFASANPSLIDGLVLWAAYPINNISGVKGIDVLSVSGSEDGLTTSQDVEESRSSLPPGSRFVVVEGAVHSFFGDYGEQAGDGTPTVDRRDAQATIVNRTIRWLDRTAGR